DGGRARAKLRSHSLVALQSMHPHRTLDSQAIELRIPVTQLAIGRIPKTVPDPRDFRDIEVADDDIVALQ
ncbi:hypothetical protein, partial [Xanthomonas hortorum]|uniref:hypothetical protein n=1 Tax=Xanthomonas hortorum TaxID=56454 RepID=UPI0019D3D366